MTALPGLHIRTWGDGSQENTAVLIHGLAGAADTWDEMAASLVVRGYRCIAPDLRGHGASPNPDDSFEMPALVDNVAASVPVAPDLLIGFSFGGGIALLAVGAGKLAPKRLVLIDPAVRSHAPAQAERMPNTTAPGAAVSMTTRWSVIRRALAASAPWDARPALDTLAGHIPTLVVLAGRRSNVSTADAQIFETKLGSGSVVTIPGASHAVHQGHLPELLAALDRWLTEISPAGASPESAS